MQNSDKEREIAERFEKFIYENNPSNEFLLQIFELAGSYLNLQTISDYAKANGLSYNGVKKTRNITEKFGCRFVIDNE